MLRVAAVGSAAIVCGALYHRKVNAYFRPSIPDYNSDMQLVRRTDLLDSIRRHFESHCGDILLITGQTGVGKSTAVRQVTRGESGMYIHVTGDNGTQQLMEGIKYIGYCTPPPILVVDVDHFSCTTRGIAEIHAVVRDLTVKRLVRGVIVLHESKARDIHLDAHTRTIRVNDFSPDEADVFMTMYRMFPKDEGMRQRIISEIGTRPSSLVHLYAALRHDLKLETSANIESSNLANDTINSVIDKMNRRALIAMIYACDDTKTKNLVGRLLLDESISWLAGPVDETIMTYNLVTGKLEFRSTAYRRAAAAIMNQSFVIKHVPM